MTLQPGTYKIHNFKSKTAIDLNGADNKSLIGFNPHGGENQQWVASQLGKGWLLRSASSGKYFTTESGLRNGAPLVANDFPVTWLIEAVGGKEEDNIYWVDWPNSPFTLDMEHGSSRPGAKVQLWEKHKLTDHQKWIFERCEISEVEVVPQPSSTTTTTTIITTTVTTTVQTG